ncbi:MULTISPECIES: DUF1699 family protein [Methanosarcina]|jgi:hypothetical protein|uniref:DUF1699 domain-containing protein n=4 Tax=Methanosarcina mazei TaxID=2209 RepID=A0A4P8R0E2_METMZ|nr:MULTISPECIES: DUF1699 family protein [Methanosarcina]AAM30472.1 conserved protein [Methanosarcina mazei Go1]AKB39534.1 Ribosomal protein S6 [Methanosarcina mazei WWM610]AKB70434.1 Ribosomal protein S6 [Methanosarcina mazei C16]MDY0247891.1 DUF1699 family protein [Methanosarcina mazei]NLO31356.1 DUF1699 family protein [Methanosarcina mazei]
MGLGSIRIRVVTNRDEIPSLEQEERAVHLAFRPSDKDLFSLVKTCPSIEILQLPASSYDGLSKFIKMYLSSSGIHLVKGDVSGHWHDLNNYFVIPSYVLEKIKELEVQGRTEEEIIGEVTNLRKISPDMILHLLHSSFLSPGSERPEMNRV